MTLDKKKGIVLITTCLAAAILCLLIFLNISAKSDHRRVNEQYSEMLKISVDYGAMKAKIESVEQRIGLAKAENISIVIEKIMSDMGLRDKLQSVKPFGGGSRAEYEIQEAEIVLDNLTLNELVNILYGIYTTPAGLFVTAADYERDFSSQNTIDARMSLKLVMVKEKTQQ